MENHTKAIVCPQKSRYTSCQATAMAYMAINELFVAGKAMEIFMEKYEDLFMPSFLKEKGTRTQFPEDISLAMAYIPLQLSLKTYSGEEGLNRGTIFPELDKEFCEGRKA